MATDPRDVKNSEAETRRFERENTDPTIPFDGSDPANIAGPASNVQIQKAADKRAAAADGLSTRLRPAHAQQEAETGDAITDSDVIANPAAGLNVGEDAGAKARADAEKAAADEEARVAQGTPGRTGRSGKQQTS
jgi:hypothetical protein